MRGLTPYEAAVMNIAGFGGRTSALLVVKGTGRIVVEHYQAGHDVHTAQRTFSVAKSLAATLIGNAVLRGKLDVAAPAAIAEWHRQAIRAPSSPPNSSCGWRAADERQRRQSHRCHLYVGGASVRAWTTQWPLLNPPGSRYRYANDTLLGNVVVEGRAGEGGRGARSRGLDRLGMTRTFVEHDKDGDFILSSQVWTTARDLARLGLLYLNDGMADGERRYSPPTGGASVSTPSGPQPDGPFGYGAGFWLLDKSVGVPSDFGAFGNRGQYVVGHSVAATGHRPAGYDDAAQRLDIAKSPPLPSRATTRPAPGNKAHSMPVAREAGHLVQLFHPADPFGDLDLRARGYQVGTSSVPDRTSILPVPGRWYRRGRSRNRRRNGAVHT